MADNVRKLPDWYPDELAHAGPEHLDAAYVAAYDRKAATDPREDLQLLLGLGVEPIGTLVDLGAGTGTFAIAAAPHVRRVVAVDVSEPMLGVLRERVEREGIANVEPVRAGFLSYAHSGAQVDVVYSRHALHHLPDFWKVVALRRIAGMLRPGGVFLLRDLIYAFAPEEVEGVIEPWLARAADDPVAGWTRAELATHVREEFSPFSWLLEPMLERAGFAIRDVRRHGPAYATYACERR